MSHRWMRNWVQWICVGYYVQQNDDEKIIKIVVDQRFTSVVIMVDKQFWKSGLYLVSMRGVLIYDVKYNHEILKKLIMFVCYYIHYLLQHIFFKLLIQKIKYFFVISLTFKSNYKVMLKHYFTYMSMSIILCIASFT